MRYGLALFMVVIALSSVHAEIKTQLVEYRDGDVTLEGFVAWDTALALRFTHKWW